MVRVMSAPVDVLGLSEWMAAREMVMCEWAARQCRKAMGVPVRCLPCKCQWWAAPCPQECHQVAQFRVLFATKGQFTSQGHCHQCSQSRLAPRCGRRVSAWLLVMLRVWGSAGQEHLLSLLVQVAQLLLVGLLRQWQPRSRPSNQALRGHLSHLLPGLLCAHFLRDPLILANAHEELLLHITRSVLIAHCPEHSA